MDINYLNTTLVIPGMLSEIIYFEELGSTNKYSKQNYLNLKDNTLVITSNQTEGKGRFERVWETSAGNNLTFSLIIHSKLRLDELHFMNFYSSYILYLTVKSALHNFGDCKVRLKWPNDILLNNKKIAGILLDIKESDMETKKFIIGIGLNVNQTDFSPEIRHKASSLSKEFQTEFSPEEILITFINLFYNNAELLNSFESLMENWISATDIIGKNVRFRLLEDVNEMTAEVLKIDYDGGLVLLTANGKKNKYFSGEITFLY